GIQFCSHAIKQAVPPAGAEYEEVYAWKTCLYKLCEIVNLFETTLGHEAGFRVQLEPMLQSDSSFLHPALKEFKRFEYRVQTTASEEHAYCVLPVGLM